MVPQNSLITNLYYKYLPLCSAEQRHSYRFGTTWGWVNEIIFIFGWTIPLRPVHTKHDNYKDINKDIVLKIILNIKEQQSRHHNYNDKGTEKRYRLNHFQNDFFPADEQ